MSDSGVFFSTRLRGKPTILRLIRHSGFAQTFVSQQFPLGRVQEVVSRYYGINLDELKSSDRRPLYSHPRQIAMYLARQLTRHSLPDIAARFGGKHHTTVLHACRQVPLRMKRDPRTAEDVKVLREAIIRCAA